MTTQRTLFFSEGSTSLGRSTAVLLRIASVWRAVRPFPRDIITKSNAEFPLRPTTSGSAAVNERRRGPRLSETLDRSGLRRVDEMDAADVIVLYTCSVRQSAENRVHGQLGWVKGIKARRPETLVALAGCMATEREELGRRYPFIDLFTAPIDRTDLGEMIQRRLELAVPCAEGPVYDDGPVPVSAGLTAIEGCNKHCTYCIVPFRRGREQSIPTPALVEQADRLVRRGAKELLEQGQNINAYGRDLEPRTSLAELLTVLNKRVAGLERLRFLTSHPWHFDEELIQAIARLPAVCER